MLSLNWFVISVNDLRKKKFTYSQFSPPRELQCAIRKKFPKTEMSLASDFLEVKSEEKNYIRYTSAQDNHSDD